MEYFGISLESIENEGAEISAPLPRNDTQPIKEFKFSNSVLINADRINEKMNKINSEMESVLRGLISGNVNLESVIQFVLLEIEWRIHLNHNKADHKKRGEWLKVREGVIKLMK